MSRARTIRLAFTCVIAVVASAPCMADCTVSTTGVAFSVYDVFSPVDHDITGSITVRCRPGAPYSLSLSPGSGTYGSRTMTNGPYALNYNLYVDATRLAVWGDGSAGTATVSGDGKDATHAVYGRIPALQNAYVGSYADTIIVTITF